MVYGLGDSVSVRIDAVDVDTRSIDFVLVHETQRRRKKSGKKSSV